ncbi:MAG: hypothetical protein ACOZNI_09400 [Myxococcota bacterium]
MIFLLVALPVACDRECDSMAGEACSVPGKGMCDCYNVLLVCSDDGTWHNKAYYCDCLDDDDNVDWDECSEYIDNPEG